MNNIPIEHVYDTNHIFIKSKLKLSQIWVQYFIVIIKLINMIIKQINSNQIYVIQVDTKITSYSLKELYKPIWI